MVSKDTVLDLLRKQKDSVGEEGNPKQRKQEWCAAVSQLMNQIEDWLHDAEQQGLLTVERYDVQRQEKLIGSYEVPALKVVSPNGNTVRIEAKALFVVGANGRVDLERPPRKETLLRDESNQWIFAELLPGHPDWEFQSLTEAVFWDRLYKVLS